MCLEKAFLQTEALILLKKYNFVKIFSCATLENHKFYPVEINNTVVWFLIIPPLKL